MLRGSGDSQIDSRKVRYDKRDSLKSSMKHYLINSEDRWLFKTIFRHLIDFVYRFGAMGSAFNHLT